MNNHDPRGLWAQPPGSRGGPIFYDGIYGVCVADIFYGIVCGPSYFPFFHFGLIEVQEPKLPDHPPPSVTPLVMTCSDKLQTQMTTELRKHGADPGLTANVDKILGAGETGSFDPRLLVAIAGAESHFGTTNGRPYNAFGLTERVGRTDTYVPRSFTSWNQSIGFAGTQVERHIDVGQTTVAAFYSGQRGAWCVDRPGFEGECQRRGAVDARNFMLEQDGNPMDLRFPCDRE